MTIFGNCFEKADCTMKNEEKTIQPIAWFKSPFTSKFGIPRQSGVVKELEGRIVFTREFAREEAVRGLEGFDYLWIIWGFSGNDGKWNLTVRPPRLGGNKSVGVFASRSPFRPNGLGLSSARIESIDLDNPDGLSIVVSGSDLIDMTPIYDIKPYISYSDAHPDARCGFTDKSVWREADVTFPDEVKEKFLKMSHTAQGDADKVISALTRTLAQRPVPQYRNDPGRTYGMPFMGCDIRFRVSDDSVTVIGISNIE